MKLIKSSFLIIMILLLSACGMKSVLHEKEFKEFFKDKEYVIMDVDDKIESNNIINAIVSIKDDDSYKIEYYLFKDTSSAKVVYYNNRDAIKENFNGISKEITGKNYEKFSFSNDESFKVVERVEDTLIFINTEKKYKNEIERLLESMGY